MSTSSSVQMAHYTQVVRTILLDGWQNTTPQRAERITQKSVGQWFLDIQEDSGLLQTLEDAKQR